MPSSSIGKNSDQEEVGSRSSASVEENEAQSRYSGRLYVMEELEQVLPIRRGISKFYYVKSKSFTSLADASVSSSIQEIVKPGNMYARRCRNLLAFNRVWDNVRSSSPCKGKPRARFQRDLSDRAKHVALAVALTHSESYSYSSASNDSSSSNFSMISVQATSLIRPFPPFHPQSQGSLNHYGLDRPLTSIALKTGLEEQT